METLRKLARTLFGDRGRLSYRRLLAFAAATALLISGHLSEGNWLWVALGFMGLEGAVKLLEAAKGKAASLTMAEALQAGSPAPEPADGEG